MKQYAEDAAQTDTPWKRWQNRSGGSWRDLSNNAKWHPNREYRRKPPPSLREAAQAMLDMYVGMARFGDYGTTWSPEDDPEVINLRAALKAEP